MKGKPIVARLKTACGAVQTLRIAAPPIEFLFLPLPNGGKRTFKRDDKPMDTPKTWPTSYVYREQLDSKAARARA